MQPSLKKRPQIQTWGRRNELCHVGAPSLYNGQRCYGDHQTDDFAPILTHVFRWRVAISGVALLMPVWVRQRERADFVQAFDFGVGKGPGSGGEVVAELLLVARAYDYGIDAGFARHP